MNDGRQAVPSGDAPAPTSGRARALAVAAGVLGLLILASCGQGDAPAGQPDGPGGEVIADAAAYPGEPGGMVGTIVRTESEVAELWSAVGFSGAPPVPDEEVIVVVAGGESGTCPWEPRGAVVTDDGGVVTVDLGEHGEQACTEDWNPRTVAVAVPAERVGEDPEVRVLLDGTEQTVEPLELGELEGRADDPADEPTPTDAFLFVEVEVRPAEDAAPTTETYACDAEGGSLDGDEEACAALVEQRAWLVEGDPDDQVCTQQYGGPEVAELRGDVDGQAFERRVDRTDGCGIERWDRLEPVLGEPGGPADQGPPVTE